MRVRLSTRLAVVLAGGYLLASCGKPSASNAGGAQASTGGAVLPPAQAASRAPAGKPEEPFRLATLRPDTHIAWRGHSGPVDADGLIMRLRGALGRTEVGRASRHGVGV